MTSSFGQILVTGGAGFIGSAVCRQLVEDYGALVINVDKLTYAANLRSLDSIADNPNYCFEQRIFVTVARSTLYFAITSRRPSFIWRRSLMSIARSPALKCS